MKKTVLILVLFALLSVLVSCANTAGAPSDMQLCFGGDDVGYYFYTPKGWSNSNTGNMHASYVSRVNITSVSFVEVEIDDEVLGTLSKEDYFFKQYFKDSLKEFPKAPKILTDGQNTLFGKKDGEVSYQADKAVKYTYEYEYDKHSFTAMQILLQKGEKFYIFTYNSMNEIYSGEETYYDFNLQNAQKCIDEFKFVTPSQSGSEQTFEKDSDGFLLYSDSSLARYDLYVPEAYALDYASAIVSATREDGTNITVSRAVSTGVTSDKYWERRKTELSAIVTNLVEADGKINQPFKCGNADDGRSFEYTYEYNGEKFRIFQVLAIKGYYGYVLTFTATDENYENHIQEFEKVCDKVVFK